jgi:hypothetical protein
MAAAATHGGGAAAKPITGWQTEQFAVLETSTDSLLTTSLDCSPHLQANSLIFSNSRRYD